MKRKSVFLLIVFFVFNANLVWACHKGGAMGFADNDPGAFSVDLTLSPIFTSGSTSGTAGCQNWDYAHQQKIQFISTEWEFLAEEASKGKGERLQALASLMGCSEQSQPAFSSMLQHRYNLLFVRPEHHSDFITRLNSEIQLNPNVTCSG